MTQTLAQQTSVGSRWLIDAVADCLQVPADQIDPHTPLVRYGLDSLAAIQLTTAVAAELGEEVPLDLLLDHPNLQSLEDYIGGRVERSSPPGFEFTQLLADSILPEEIRPQHRRARRRRPQSILLTGATGFLGAYLLRALLRAKQADIYCIVRSSPPADPLASVRQNLDRYGIWEDDYEPRLHAVYGDLLQPALGWSHHRYASLAAEIDEIYHCAAAVNWVFPYVGLRDVNVLGVRELLRLACREKMKPFHFISSISVCYSTLGPGEVTEANDMFPHLGGIHLGYAQSKCVAEELVRKAHQRGLPATIHRPSLIAGDAQSGVSNSDDLLSTMIQGCVQMGSAPDLDWVLDGCPVDYVADAIAGLAQSLGDTLQVFHLASPQTRHWREIVLWMNLYGYRIELAPYSDWLLQLEIDAKSPEHPLHRLRDFFLARPASAEGLSIPQLYEQRRRGRVHQTQTQAALSRLPLACPPLDLRLLDRYFTSMVERGLLPAVDGAKRQYAPSKLDRGFFEALLRQHFSDPMIRVRKTIELDDSWHDSITAELTSWRFGADMLSRYQVILESNGKHVPDSPVFFVKRKPRDDKVLDVAQCVATVCGQPTGEAFARHKHRLGAAGCHLREAGFYRQQDERIRRHTPAFIGAEWDQRRQESILVLENISHLDAASADHQPWPRRRIEAAICGIAEVHAVWYGREQELLSQQWLGSPISAKDMSAMSDLWTALADHSRRSFAAWAPKRTLHLVRHFIAHVGQWWKSLEEMPRTLIHNDFNPRNIAFRRNNENLGLCVYDWELATVGVPQHDLAELLCFVLAPGVSPNEALYYIELHRHALQRAIGRRIDPQQWRQGFELSLRDLVLNRLPMYCLIHTVRRQSFLERAVRTWQTLYEYVEGRKVESQKVKSRSQAAKPPHGC